MKINRDNIDELNAVITIRIEKSDYEERVENILKDYRKKARIDGFRPGKVPQGMINKMYRKPVLLDELNKMLNESLTKYITDEKLYILGEPLAHKEEKAEIDLDRDSEFEFSFDIAMAPDLDGIVTEKDKLPYYTIKTDKEELEKQIDRIRSRYGTYKDQEFITGNEMIKADLMEEDHAGNLTEGGIKVDDTSILLDVIKNEKIKKQFKGKKSGDALTIEVKKAFENETDLAAMLKIEKDKISDISDHFRIVIKSVSSFEKGDINQDLWDKMYGKDAVKTDEEFRQKISDELKSAFSKSSDYKFNLDAREYYLKKFKKDLPEAFLKRWLLETNKDKFTEEQIEKEFAAFVTDLKWQLIKGKITREKELKISEEELHSFARDAMKQQFIQYYGIADVPAELLDKYAMESLGHQEERNRYIENLNESKVYDFIRNTIKLDNKEVTLEKFNSLIEKK